MTSAYASLGADGTIAPSLDEFVQLAADRRVIPVCRRLLADGFTPISLYRALAAERPGTQWTFEYSPDRSRALANGAGFTLGSPSWGRLHARGAFVTSQEARSTAHRPADSEQLLT